VAALTSRRARQEAVPAALTASQIFWNGEALFHRAQRKPTA
jgi:hypothetical protein